MSLFSSPQKPPLAERVRPTRLSEVIGQTQLTNSEGHLSRWIASGHLPSIILWGPPGTGKTTLARLLANELNRPLLTLNATSSGVKELRQHIEASQGTRPLLFIDEIHRFNKAQQDALLPAVEAGQVTLIGATTENPSFEVNAALLSRCQVVVLKELGSEEIAAVVKRAFSVDQDLKQRSFEIQDVDALYRLSGGDARRALNLVEILVALQPEELLVFDADNLERAAQQRVVRYDKTGDQHYDIISAFIKSIRGSDPNAGIYWMARMLAGGEDPLFIARRLVILASEDIGNANPTAAVLASACFESVHRVGMPEARIILAQTVTYLATSPKSNASYVAIDAALEEVKRSGDLPVPMHLRNAPNRMMKNMGYGKDYKYSHEYSGSEGNQEFLPEELSGTAFYQPRPVGREKELLESLRRQWQGHYPYE